MRGTACNTLRWLVVLATSSGVSCRGIGPPTIGRDRIDYVSSSGESGKRRTLLLAWARRALRRDRQRRRDRRLPANQ